MKYACFLSFIFCVLISSCNNGTKTANDSPFIGSINVSVDETLRPIADAQVNVYTHTYPSAKINIQYRSENQCIEDLLNDCSQVIFLGRALNEQEKNVFLQKKFSPKSLKIATDAIALIVNKSDKDTVMSMDKISRIFKGLDNNKLIVFDNAQSGTVNYIVKKFGLDKMPKNVFAAKTNLDAVKYVADNAE